MAITADRLVTGIKRRVTIAANQALLTDTDLLAMADDIIGSRIVPLLESVNQEYFVTYTTTPLVASQTDYAIPYRAVARGLRELKMSDGNDNVRNLALISLEDAQLYSSSGVTLGFYFLGDKVHLVPDVPSSLSQGATLLFWYRLPPSSLVTSSSAVLATVVSSTVVTSAAVPSTMTPGVTVDFVQGQSGSSIYAMDIAITGATATTLTFASGAIPTSFAVGDYIALAGQSPVVNFVPNELYSLIESLTAARALASVGDFEGAKFLADDVAIEERNAKMLLEPRIDGEPTVIVNRYGLVRGSKFGQRRWLYGQ